MESPVLNNDIHEYLEKFLRPKKYSLLDKFCRDIYFRKNGVRIRIVEKYRPTDLCSKYRVKILEILCGVKQIKNFEEMIKISKNIFYIKYDRTSIEDYVFIRENFTNLDKLKYEIAEYREAALWSSVLKFPPLKGVSISINGYVDRRTTELFILMGYEVYSGYGNVDEIQTDIVRKNAKWECVWDDVFDISQYPNLKSLSIGDDSDFVRKNRDMIGGHPNLKKIFYDKTLDLEVITKKDGTIIKNILKSRYKFELGEINIERYEKAKTLYSRIKIHHQENIEKLIEYEKCTKNPKRVILEIDDTNFGYKIEESIKLELIDLFDLHILVSHKDINEYFIDFKLRKTKANKNGITFTLMAGTKKFWITKSFL